MAAFENKILSKRVNNSLHALQRVLLRGPASLRRADKKKPLASTTKTWLDNTETVN